MFCFLNLPSEAGRHAALFCWLWRHSCIFISCPPEQGWPVQMIRDAGFQTTVLASLKWKKECSGLALFLSSQSSVLGSGFGELAPSKMVNISSSQILDKLKAPSLSPFAATSSAQQNSTSPPATTASWDLKPSASQSSVLNHFGKCVFWAALVYWVQCEQ